MRAKKFPCGHKMTAENSVSFGGGRALRCRECHRAEMREYMRRRAAAKKAAAWAYVPEEHRP